MSKLHYNNMVISLNLIMMIFNSIILLLFAVSLRPAVEIRLLPRNQMTTENDVEYIAGHDIESETNLSAKIINPQFNREVPKKNTKKVITEDLINEFPGQFSRGKHESRKVNEQEFTTKYFEDFETNPEPCGEDVTYLIFKQQGYIDEEGNYDEDKLFLFFDNLMDGIYNGKKKFLFIRELFAKCAEKKATSCETVLATFNCAYDLYSNIPPD